MKLSSFLLQFQESVDCSPSMTSARGFGITKTSSREESDQDRDALCFGTMTRTEAREESDQDISQSNYNSIPRDDTDYH